MLKKKKRENGLGKFPWNNLLGRFPWKTRVSFTMWVWNQSLGLVAGTLKHLAAVEKWKCTLVVWEPLIYLLGGWWFQRFFMFIPIWGFMIQFDENFSDLSPEEFQELSQSILLSGKQPSSKTVISQGAEEPRYS